MKILHLLAPGGVGGLEQVVRNLSDGHAGEGHDVSVAAIVPRRGVDVLSLRHFEDSGVRLIRLPLPPRAYMKERADFAHLCEQLRPDIVHTHGSRPDVVSAGVARAQGIPTVTTVHGFTGGGLRNRMYQKLQIASFRRFEAVVAVSRPLARRLAESGVPAGRIRTIQNAWSERGLPLDRRMARRRLQIDDDDFLIGWVGRLSREKGADLLLSAMAHLTDLPLTVSIVGDGPERYFLQERIKGRSWRNRVHWHGALPEAGRYFPAFDAFVLSSRTEGTPMVLFEAMAGIVPIVAADVGGVSDVISTGEAILVPPEDPAALAQGIRTVYRSPGAARARAHAAHRRLRRDFGPGPWLSRYEALYRELVHGAPERVRPIEIWSRS
jgi:glycosyltransferase involved in cell wall biosynthesis